MIRKGKLNDAESIFSLVDLYSTKGQMLHRSLKEIEKNIDDFLVYEQDQEIAGACSLKYGWDHLVEIRSLAVGPTYSRQGFATGIVQECIEQAQQHSDIEGIFVLTYAIPLFLKLGFEIISKSAFPLKVWEDCMSCSKREACDETAMFRTLKPVETSFLNLVKPSSSQQKIAIPNIV